MLKKLLFLGLLTSCSTVQEKPKSLLGKTIKPIRGAYANCHLTILAAKQYSQGNTIYGVLGSCEDGRILTGELDRQQLQDLINEEN